MCFCWFCQFIGKSNEVNKNVLAVQSMLRHRKDIADVVYKYTDRKNFYCNISKKKAKTLPYTSSHALRSHAITSANVK